jgi:hypothetical protein
MPDPMQYVGFAVMAFVLLGILVTVVERRRRTG